MVTFERLLGLLAEASSRIRDIETAANSMSAEGEGRDLLEMRIEDAHALAQDIDQALVDAGER